MSVPRFLSITVCAALLSVSLASSQAMNQDALKWGAGPPHLPPGVEIAVMDGDPSKAVPITLRLKMPAGYQIAAHWHPTQENITVLSGRLYVGMGDVLSKSAGTLLKPGGFAAMSARMNHFVWTDEATVVQLHLNGPFEITYVNPSDDPRK